MTERGGRERRRGARISASLSVEVVGHGSSGAECRGDISSSGVYVEGDPGAGVVGTVTHLRIGKPDSDRVIELLGRVVRRLVVEDLLGSRVAGVAFEFLFTDDETRAEVAQLVEYVAKKREASGRAFSIQHAFDAEVGRPADERHDAVVYLVGVDRLSLETGWLVPRGEVIECVVRAPRSHREFTFTGSVVQSRPVADADDERYRVDIQFASEVAPPAPMQSGQSIDDAIRVLLDESIHPDEYARPQGLAVDMRGTTATVPLPALLGLAGDEGLTGTLVLEGPEATGSVYLRDGHVIDAGVDAGGDDPREALLAMIEWPEAEFRFTAGPVDREDAVGAKTWVLLLELARDRDEHAGD